MKKNVKILIIILCMIISILLLVYIEYRMSNVKETQNFSDVHYVVILNNTFYEFHTLEDANNFIDNVTKNGGYYIFDPGYEMITWRYGGINESSK